MHLEETSYIGLGTTRRSEHTSSLNLNQTVDRNMVTSKGSSLNLNVDRNFLAPDQESFIKIKGFNVRKGAAKNTLV
jgi:hypothetical protein